MRDIFRGALVGALVAGPLVALAAFGVWPALFALAVITIATAPSVHSSHVAVVEHYERVRWLQHEHKGEL